MARLVGKLAVVTGSTSGIGLGIAKELAKNGCNLILAGLEDNFDPTVNDMKAKYGVCIEYFGADLAQKANVKKMVEWILELHPDGIDILINNAGFNHIAYIEDYPDEQWDAMVGVQLTLPFQLIKHFTPGMKNKGWGRIINMSSQMGLVSFPRKAVYSAVKSGLIGLTKGVALEVATHGITCNAICPTYIRTQLFDDQMEQNATKMGISFEEAVSATLSGVPTGRAVTIEQVVDLMLFLVSSQASSDMTGAAYLIDGGFTAQ